MRMRSMIDGFTARPADQGDIEAIRMLETAAGAPFRDIGMDWVADDSPPGTRELTKAIAAGEIFVVDAGAVSGTDPDTARPPAAWLWLVDHGDDLHIEQVSVHPALRGRRLGCRLIEAAASAARNRGKSGLTLTTFLHVPWNAPLYRTLGFEDLHADSLHGPLASIREHEAAIGLDASPRVAMRRDLQASPPRPISPLQPRPAGASTTR